MKHEEKYILYTCYMHHRGNREMAVACDLLAHQCV